jgi:hypothetical protein
MGFDEFEGKMIGLVGVSAGPDALGDRYLYRGAAVRLSLYERGCTEQDGCNKDTTGSRTEKRQ